MGFWDEPPGEQRVRLVFREDDSDGRFTVTSVTDPVDGCSIQPGRTSEDYSTGQGSRQPFTVYGPAELARLRTWDAVDLELVPGSGQWQRATLDGPPRVWGSSPPNVQLAVLVVAG